MASKTQIKFRSKKKTNPAVSAAIAAALKSKGWHGLAQRLSAGTRNHSAVNLAQIERITTTGDTVVVPGKILGGGEVTKRIRVCALSFSASAIIKLKKMKSEIVQLHVEIQQNKRAEGVKIIT